MKKPHHHFRGRLWSGLATGLLLAAGSLRAGLVIEDIGKQYSLDPQKTPPGLCHHLADRNQASGGNTSVRNEEAAHLKWKGTPDANGYGYFQRNRDLGQVFNLPAGPTVKLDAIVLRTGRGKNAVMAGTPGAQMYVQFYQVRVADGSVFRINENGTGKGQQATHGFDRQFNRADDFVEGAVYVPLRRVTGGVFPPVKPTTQSAYATGSGQPHGEQAGHLHFLRFKLTGEDQLLLQGGKRYAFMVGFEEPGAARGLGLAVDSAVHLKEPARFVHDLNGQIRWGIRREGNGRLPPTMIDGPEPPTDPRLRRQLIAEAVFAPNHWDTLSPTSDGYPDVQTYMTLQFYLEVQPVSATR